MTEEPGRRAPAPPPPPPWLRVLIVLALVGTLALAVIPGGLLLNAINDGRRAAWVDHTAHTIASGALRAAPARLEALMQGGLLGASLCTEPPDVAALERIVTGGSSPGLRALAVAAISGGGQCAGAVVALQRRLQALRAPGAAERLP